MRKKIVWLPYDFDTALGINNEGALVFDYELEDTDHIEGGANVYNGQDSVVWNNIRDAFGKELASMYQTLRSQGKLSYSAVEKAFEDHQDKWSEAIFNEDAWFKYIDPLINEGNGAYLEMLQGSKKEQRKWWLYNRFRYIDSKYNAGDALVDVIQLRGYAKANITVIPYADIYPTVKYGSYLVHQRGKRGVATTLVNPLDSVNDTEIYIYSSSQLASVGDLSGLLVGFADFSMATKLQELKLGSDAVGYSNPNLKTLTLGNNVLLKKIDVRNCVGLGTGDQKSVDISGCTNIEEIYFDGTNITGLQLPNGGIIKKLHLPETVTNLTVMNQKAVTEFVIPTYQNISTLRLENVSDAIDQIEILKQIPANSRVRLIGFYLLADDAQEIEQIFDILDTMRGLDEHGNNTEKAQVSGEIHTASLTGAEIAEFNARYPYVRVTADHTSAVLTYKTYDGATTLFTETVLDGGNGTKVNTTARIADAQYTYEPDGWSLTQDGNKDADALVGVTADRTVFASYTKTLRKYTVTWKNADNTILETDTNVPYGSTPSYNGATPTYQGQTYTGWSPAVSTVVGDVTYTAQYKPMYTATFVRASADGGGTLYTQNYVVEGTTPVYGGATPTSTQGSAEDYPFEGWTPALGPIYANTTYTAKFGSPIDVSEITDSWDTIIANIDNGTYKTAYKLGQYKPLDLGTEGTVNMQIVAMDADELADGSGYAPLTFLGMSTLVTLSKMYYNSSNVGGWKNSLVRSRLKNVILPLVPSNVKSRINNVIKISSSGSSDTSSEISNRVYRTIDNLWIPSQQEMNGNSYYENVAGAIAYTKIFNNQSSRVINQNCWLRTANKDKANGFYKNMTNGQIVTDNFSENTYYIRLGFCLGAEAETITDSWDTIIANTSPETSYSIGDTKWMALSSGEKVLMQIVGFNCDELADGNGVARISWISKYLLNDSHVINSEETTSGGWQASGMRSYLNGTIKPMLPENIRNGIQTVKKYSSTYENGTFVKDGQTTNDDLWIPCHKEIFDSTIYETQSPSYSTVFTDNVSRKKARVSSTTAYLNYWTRSTNSSAKFMYVGYDGSSLNQYVTTRMCIALGFCTGVKTD